jgi:hypothetical protein
MKGNTERNVMIGLCVVATLAAIGVLIFLVARHQDNFCGACQNMGLQVNTDRPLIRKLYNSGELTENSELVRGDKWKRGPYVGSQFHQYPESETPGTCS